MSENTNSGLNNVQSDVVATDPVPPNVRIKNRLTSVNSRVLKTLGATGGGGTTDQDGKGLGNREISSNSRPDHIFHNFLLSEILESREQ